MQRFIFNEYMECQLLYMQNLIIMGENIKIDNKEIKL